MSVMTQKAQCLIKHMPQQPYILEDDFDIITYLLFYMATPCYTYKSVQATICCETVHIVMSYAEHISSQFNGFLL